MDSFFNTLKKGLVAMMFIVVGFSMTYVPQLPTSQIKTVEAGPSGVATEFTQVANNALIAAGNAINTITAGAVSLNWIKENVLDGIGWAIAKRIVSGMVRSLINWVNSGFQGSPSFISDLKGFLLNIADEEFGRVISEMGELGSFICSPFRLDVQISLEMQYAQGRATGQSAPTCTLSGIVDNIEGFISGIDPGNGLSDWLQITSTPQTYTPYGAVLNAEVAARARLINAEGQVLTEVNWGDGFLSQKICEGVGGDSNGQQCSITKPGRVIADQLNKALGAGQDALIEADEINELIAALLGQLANKALTGVAGLLGLSGGTGYTESGYDGSYLDQLVDESDSLLADVSSQDTTNPADALNASSFKVVDGSTISEAEDLINEQTELQTQYRDLHLSYQKQLSDFITDESEEQINGTSTPGREQRIRDARNELSRINNRLDDSISNVLTLENLAQQDPQAEITVELRGPRLTQSMVANESNRLSQFMRNLRAIPVSSNNLNIQLASIGPSTAVRPTNLEWVATTNSPNRSI